MNLSTACTASTASVPPARRAQVRRRERLLLLAVALMAAVALAGPALQQPAQFHDFADRRAWGPLPHALDVLSNLPFAAWGLAGLGALACARRRGAVAPASAGLAGLFFAGLLATAGVSACYHWQPDDAGLVWDRLGMVLAFAGLLGLAALQAAGRCAGLALAAAVLLLGPATVWAWAASGNLLPWGVLQLGGMVLILGLAGLPPAWDAPGLRIRWALVLGVYALAKALELADHAVFALSGELVSGHSLKHVVASFAAWPVLSAVLQARGRGTIGAPSVFPKVADARVQPPPPQESGMRVDVSFPASAAPAMPAPPAPAHPNQFALLGQRRFAPFFWTQFSGAANDNLFKFAFTVMVTYQLSVGWLPPALAGLAIGALFILPFLLFSATSGQLTDKFEKTRIIRFVKNLEVAIMALAAVGFMSGNVNVQVPVLLGCTFLMGLHSTLFGPVKFAYLPQALTERELTGGNGMVEMGTFVAILLGNIVGGLLVAIPGVGPQYVALSCVALALAGRVVAQFIPQAPATDPGLHINWNPVSETWRNLKLAKTNLVVFRSMLGISWMWFFGAVFLSQFPSFAKEVLHGDEHVASLLLVVFSIGIATGSLLCEVLSRRHVEIGLVPLGAIGMSVFAIDLYFAARGLPASSLMGVGVFMGHAAHWRVILDLALLSLFAGLYSVPMYALIQLRSQPTHRARIIAANNILNALFMIVSAILAGALLKAEFTIPQIFLFTGLANAVVAFYIFMLVPEYLLRFVALLLSRCIYRFKVTGDEHIPAQGAAVLTCNHVSFIDPVLLMAASSRPIYFLMDHRIFKMPVLGWLFRLAKAIPVAPRAEDPVAYEAAFEAAAKVLREGDLLAIFPEGGITHDGQLQPFKGGIMKILDNARRDGVQAPVVPMALTNLWGSFFSRVEQVDGKGVAMVRPFRRGVFSRVGLNVGAPLAPTEASPGVLQARVATLMKA